MPQYRIDRESSKSDNQEERLDWMSPILMEQNSIPGIQNAYQIIIMRKQSSSGETSLTISEQQSTIFIFLLQDPDAEITV